MTNLGQVVMWAPLILTQTIRASKLKSRLLNCSLTEYKMRQNYLAWRKKAKMKGFWCKVLKILEIKIKTRWYRGIVSEKIREKKQELQVNNAKSLLKSMNFSLCLIAVKWECSTKMLLNLITISGMRLLWTLAQLLAAPVHTEIDTRNLQSQSIRLREISLQHSKTNNSNCFRCKRYCRKRLLLGQKREEK